MEGKLKVSNMSCGHCVKAVTTTLESLPSITDIEVILENETASFNYDPEKINLVDSYSEVIDEKSFKSVTVLAGDLIIKSDNDKLHLSKGDSAFIPANSGSISFSGKCEFITARI